MTENLQSALATVPVMAIVRHRVAGDTVGAVRALIAGGIRAVEVTTSTPGWAQIVAESRTSGVAVGAGTITSVAELELAAEAGASFAVSPGLQPEVVRAALRLGVEPVPGVATGTEILAARDLGVRLFKLFPAGGLGLGYFRELRGPFADLNFMPTGGIEIESMASWFAAGATAVALGSALAGREAPTCESDRAALVDRARVVVAQATAGRLTS